MLFAVQFRMMIRIGVVMVTYNRLPMLKESLQCYENQTLLPKYMIIVNNNSNDGTKEYLEQWSNKSAENIQKIVINLDENLGGSGGFNIGISKCLEFDADWIWIADDDAFPEENCFYELNKFANSDVVHNEQIVSICSMNLNGENIDITHRWRLANFLMGRINYPVPETEYQKEYFFLDVYSFVGAAVKKQILDQVGPPRKDFFIYGDDFEHAVRVRKQGKIVCVPKIVVHHQNNSSGSSEVSWRDYYDTRNVLWICKNHFGNYSFFIRSIMRIVTVLKSGNTTKLKLTFQAIKDAQKGKTGIHDVYKPGWIPNSK